MKMNGKVPGGIGELRAPHHRVSPAGVTFISNCYALQMQPSRCVGCREPGLVPVLPDVVDVTRDFWLVAPAERRELARIKALWDYLRRVTELNQDFLMGQSAEIQWVP